MANRIRNTGILLYPPFRIGNGRISLSFRDSAEQMRFFLFYFDNIAHVDVNLQSNFGFISSSEEDILLLDSGVIGCVPPRIIATGEMDEKILAHDMSKLFRKANAGPDKWALSIPPGFVADYVTEQYNSAILNIRDIMPSPDLSIPISDILSFKLEKIDVLRRMHISIDKIFSVFPYKDNLDLALDDLKRRIEDVSDALESSGFPYFNISFSISSAILASVGASLSLLANEIGMDQDIANILGASLGGISVIPRKSSLSRSGNMYPDDFEYIFEAKKRGILSKNDVDVGIFGGVRPTSLSNNIFSSYVPQGEYVNGWTGGGYLNGNTAIEMAAHHPSELAEYFQGWEKYRVFDEDEKLDTRN